MVDPLTLLRKALNDPDAEFRPGQLEAINAVLEPPYRALVVQATAWGKSMVYFIATKVLREQERGPTLVISPLLALMRNQVEAATNLGLRAATYDSENTGDWNDIEEAVQRNEVDLLLISPERLANTQFQDFIASTTLAKVGLIVIDEAHCISDWGHDFRPDYQRLGDLVRRLPVRTSVLATTATANNRVVQDVEAQVGQGIRIIRGSLARKSLCIQVMTSRNAAERLAWLDTHLDSLPGSGIIYVLTTRESDKVTAWLQSRGHNVLAYHSRLDADKAKVREIRVEREQALLTSDVKALVSTVALGMGFDKRDLGFVVHYQSPGNLVAYYQQIGRAGRAVSNAVAVLFIGNEDAGIHEFFLEHARPDPEIIDMVLRALEASERGLKESELMHQLNLTQTEIRGVMKFLSVLSKSPVTKSGSTYLRNPNPYQHDREKDERLAEQRRQERAALEAFAATDGCFMELVRRQLDDEHAEPCGRCSNCAGREIVSSAYSQESLQAALLFLRRSEIAIPAKRRWMAALTDYGFSGNIPESLRAENGLCLSEFGDPGLAEWVRQDKLAGHFRDELVEAAVEALHRAMPEVRPEWVCAVPSLRSDQLVPAFASRLATELGIPYVDAVTKVKQTEPQKDQRVSSRQAANLDGAFVVNNVKPGVVLLVDDMVDSGWTFTIIAALLRRAGADQVVPLALTSTKNRGADA